jgi:asparagine synthase (glutamine-hydrolysing)
MPALQSQHPDFLASFFHVSAAELDNPFFSHVPRWELTSKAKLFFSPELKRALSGGDAQGRMLHDMPDGFGAWDPFSRAQYIEARYLLPGYLLSSQGDRMAMAHAVEGRYPFLDHRVVEIASRIPPALKMRVLNEKYILKRAAGDLIPPAVRKRPKQPYRAPDVTCFFDTARQRARFPYVEEMLSPGAVSRAGVFHPDAVSRLVNKARTGQVIGVRDGMALVAILSTQLLVHQFILHPWRQADGTAVD